MTPLARAFREGVAMFQMKYGATPEKAFVSSHVKKMILRLYKRNGYTGDVTFQGLPIYDLTKAAARPEIHMVKEINGERWIQTMQLKPSMVQHGGVELLEGYEYDSEEEAEWLTSESELESKAREKDIVDRLKGKS